jgi:predicted RNA-binding protein YlxR (DUF448 family)
MVKQRHIPIRTCVACRATDEKRDLLRVVRQPDGSVRYDPKGKLAGRGAYVCASANCIALARKQKKLERSLKISGVPEELFIELSAHAAQMPDGRADSSSTVAGTSEGAVMGATEEAESIRRGAEHAPAPRKSEVKNA